jgi:O-succinylbenzoate synthase
VVVVKIAEARYFSFKLPLTAPLIIQGQESTYRQGFAMQISDEQGHSGWGEISPLPGFSRETIEDVQARFHELTDWLQGQSVPEACEQLDGTFESWLAKLHLPASLRFGVESAVLNLLANARQLPLSVLLGGNQLQTIPINALLSGSAEQVLKKAHETHQNGYRAVKVKVGRSSIHDEISFIKQVAGILGDTVSLRLDANQNWSMEDALTFAKGIAGCRIEYIEEPCRTLAESREFSVSTGLLVALDESLLKFNPQELNDYTDMAAVVLKPTLLGGIERALQFARMAKSLGLAAVISSSYESSLGILTLAHLAAAIGGQETPVGLDTLSLFEQDLLQVPLEIKRGNIILPDNSTDTIEPEPSLLQAISDV